MAICGLSLPSSTLLIYEHGLSDIWIWCFEPPLQYAECRAIDTNRLAQNVFLRPLAINLQTILHLFCGSFAYNRLMNNIACSKTEWTGFRQAGQNKNQYHRAKGDVSPAFLEDTLCPESYRPTVDYNKTHPIFDSLIRIEWEIFGSMTWNNRLYRRDTPEAEKKRFADFYLLIRRACQLLDLEKDEIEFFVTNERGVAGECHLHFLIAKRGLRKVAVDIVCLTLNFLWAKNVQLTTPSIDANSAPMGGRGVADIKPFDQKRKVEGVRYVCKREFDVFSVKEHEAEYKLSIALVKHIAEIRAEPQQRSKAPLVSVTRARLPRKDGCLTLEALTTRFSQNEQRYYRNKDPPITYLAKQYVNHSCFPQLWQRYRTLSLNCLIIPRSNPHMQQAINEMSPLSM